MHELRRYIQEQLDERGWGRADLVRRSGLSRQQVHRLLTDDRPRLPELPDDATIMALAKAFGPLSLRELKRAVIQAIGLGDGEPEISVDLAQATSAELIEEIHIRLSQPRRVEPTGETIRLSLKRFDDARTIGEWARHGYTVEFDVAGLSNTDAKRIVDFAAGLTFGLAMRIERVEGQPYQFRLYHHGPVAAPARAPHVDEEATEDYDDGLQVAAYTVPEPAGQPEAGPA